VNCEEKNVAEGFVKCLLRHLSVVGESGNARNGDDRRLSPPDLADDARSISVFVRCD